MEKLIRALYARLLPQYVRNSLRAYLSLIHPDAHSQLVTAFPEQSVLVLAPHMDDEVLGCGGTILRHVQNGARVTVAYVTDGRKGHGPFPKEWTGAEVKKAEDDLVLQRKEEARHAAQTLGIQRLVFWDYPDGSLRPAPDGIEKVRRLLHDVLPNLVYLPSLLDVHEDHWQTNCLFSAAVSNFDERSSSTMSCRGYEVWSPVPANAYVDITEFVEKKMEAMRHCESQLKEMDLIRPMISLNGYRSLRFLEGKGYAEAFFSCSLADYRRLFDQIQKETAAGRGV